MQKLSKTSTIAGLVLAGAMVLSGFFSPARAEQNGGLQSILSHGSLPLTDAGKFSDQLYLPEANGPIPVFVQLKGQGALSVLKSTKSRNAAERRVHQVEEAVENLAQEAAVLDPDSAILYPSHYTVPGIALNLSAESVKKLAERDDVVRITAIPTLEIPQPTVEQAPFNAHSSILTRAVDAWKYSGKAGQGVNIAVIDSGVDYTHAAFGGPGTPEAYREANSTMDAPDPALFDGSKYLGGYDFAGPTYNADQSSPNFNPVPDPNANPLDGVGGGHGTHVSGIAAGFGVDSAHNTFRGDYTALDADSLLQDFHIAPGAAPLAGLYALKVFGDLGGTTNLVGAAIEWVGKEIARGTKIDVVNLSLGRDFGAVDNPENAMLEALMDHGVLPVMAAGNAGDMTDIAGSPGNTGRSLAVALSASGGELQDAIAVTEPADAAAAGPYGGKFSRNFTEDFNLTAPVTPLIDNSNYEGCSPYSASDAVAVSKKIVWLEWDESSITCGADVRFDNAAAAGAVGVILTSTLDNFDDRITGNELIPGAQITHSATVALRGALEAGTLVIRLDVAGANTLQSLDPSKVDVLVPYSSRGEHGSHNGIVKPDISAPGFAVVSAAHATGFDRLVMSGTSMASPWVAGVAALTRETHPGWSADRIKAQLINTATTDITTRGKEPIPYAPTRAGTGRVDVLNAVKNSVTVASDNSGGLVTASFGVVEVGADAVTKTRTLTITNSGSTPAHYRAQYLARTQMPGVSYSVSPSSMSIPEGESAKITVTLSIPDPTALRRTLDPTMEAVQEGIFRNYVADASGVLELQPTANEHNSLRVAVFSAPKPVSDMKATGLLFPERGSATGTLSLEGRGIDQGTGSEAFASTLVPLQLGVTNDKLIFDPHNPSFKTLSSLNVRAIGAASTAPQLSDPSQGTVAFGVVVEGEWGSLKPHSTPVVSIDINQDGTEDYYSFVRPYSSFGTWVDTPVAYTVESSTQKIVDIQPINLMQGNVYTNLNDTNVLVMPVSLRALGFTVESRETEISYHVYTNSLYAPRSPENPESFVVDSTETVSFDVFNPEIWFGTFGEQSVLYKDESGTIPVHRRLDALGSDHSITHHSLEGGAPESVDPPEVLLLHLGNGAGARSAIIQPVVSPGEGATPDNTLPSDNGHGEDGPLGDRGVPSGNTVALNTSSDGKATQSGLLATTGASHSLLPLGVGGLLIALGHTALALRQRGWAVEGM
ncbi:S8 family serine peptidase [Lysinibacter sp. HNR]|uniref:S8 family serine peptidase n=1 Tax=Lysinibacter sp. HNR TaxID=3031408 RepID=UPI0024349F0E|nr:S8 family serine peptidase [Lysinibacter sp. HNR]WGD37924.1 S8 family serine peptidase [Lysinibacter sp. HNR]